VILGHRRRHLAVFVALAVLVPVGIVTSVLERAPLPVVDSLPEELVRESAATTVPDRVTWLREGALWDDLGVEVVRVPNPDGVPLIAFRPTRDLHAPKVLVYWAPGAGPTPEVPAGAVLLGALAGTEAAVFPLPPAMRDVDGRFLVYSLGHQQVLGVLPTRATRGG